MRFFSCLIIVGVLFGCTHEKTQVVPTEFQEYVDAFFLEGNLRGLNKTLMDVDLIIEFGEIEGSTLGLCRFRDNKITIDEEKWKEQTINQKYWIMFHELGHCILDREHRNDKSDNGECLSIMKGSEGDFRCALNLYSEKWWSYYLDELFEVNTLLPDWYRLYDNYQDVTFLTTVLELDTATTRFELDSIALVLPDNFNIDFEFDDWNTEENLVKIYLGNIGFGQCDRCSGTNVRISSYNGHASYYSNQDGNIQFDDHIKLTIRKIADQLIFYVNERFVHTFESDLWSKESTISTNSFDEPMNMKLVVKELE